MHNSHLTILYLIQTRHTESRAVTWCDHSWRWRKSIRNNRWPYKFLPAYQRQSLQSSWQKQKKVLRTCSYIDVTSVSVNLTFSQPTAIVQPELLTATQHGLCRCSSWQLVAFYGIMRGCPSTQLLSSHSPGQMRNLPTKSRPTGISRHCSICLGNKPPLTGHTGPQSSICFLVLYRADLVVCKLVLN